jgi:hypothetical protein
MNRAASEENGDQEEFPIQERVKILLEALKLTIDASKHVESISTGLFGALLILVTVPGALIGVVRGGAGIQNFIFAIGVLLFLISLTFLFVFLIQIYRIITIEYQRNEIIQRLNKFCGEHPTIGPIFGITSVTEPFFEDDFSQLFDQHKDKPAYGFLIRMSRKYAKALSAPFGFGTFATPIEIFCFICFGLMVISGIMMFIGLVIWIF